MIGYRVEHRIYPDGSADPGVDRVPQLAKVRLSGIVVALERAGTPATWSALVLRCDGGVESVPAEYLTVVDPPMSEVFADQPGAQAPSSTDPGESDRALDHLYRFLEDNFKETDHGGGPVEWAESLLTEFKKELLEVAAERDQLADSIKKRRKHDKPEEKPQ